MSSDPFAPQNFDVNPYAATRQNSSLAGNNPAELKHAGVGIASFILSLICGAMLLVMVVIAGVMQASTPGGMDEESAEAVALGLGLIGFMFGSFLAVVLGVIGLFQSKRKKLFAILGLLFGGFALFGVLGLMVIGMAMQQ
jgi:hypothetical protein